MADYLKFKVSSSLKDIIGKDLITDDSIAVFELVKNSYDADAQNVLISFEKDKIIIADDGNGMSITDIVDKWLFVAYSAKKEVSEGDYRDKIQKRRHYAGAKGIGRFSADRLGKKLLLTTKTLHSAEFNQISVNWDEFNNQKEKFESVKVRHDSLKSYSIPFPKNSKKGTVLEIFGTREWDRTKIINLKHSLEKLINPFSELTDFSIEIFCEREFEEDESGVYSSGLNKGSNYLNRDKVNGLVKNAILDILKLKTTQINVTINNQNIDAKLIDRGTLIYHISERNRKFIYLKDIKIDLYFLNRAAKHNFTTNMGIQPINFGSVFLFKNGFRVQPYGETGDDSWKLDFRSQQGYNRFLSTRDLFGRVEITSDNTTQFKEVSSRDGGLVETPAYHQMMEAFMEKGLKRLERYVVGVLWGEAFKRRNYFGQDDVAEAYRKELQKKDKESEDFSAAMSNLGSKIDFIQLVKSLSSDNEIEILDFNKDLVNLVNEKLDDVQDRFIYDLEKIAEKVGDQELQNIVTLTGERYQELIRDKEQAERKAQEEEAKRIKAEKLAIEEVKARERAERLRLEEEERRKRAELQSLKKEKERVEAENARLKAEKKAREEEGARRKAETSLKHEKDKNTYLTATRKTLSEDAEGLIHSIKISSIGIETGLDNILERLKSEKIGDKKLLEEIGSIKFINDKVKKLSMLVTKSSFKADQEVKKVNVAKYIQEYIETYSYAYTDKIKIEFKGQSNFISRLSVLDLSIVIDNLISNAMKAGAGRILVEARNHKDGLQILFHDSGKGVVKEFIDSPKQMFELAAKSDVEGSGIGLVTIKKKMQEMYGDIEFVGNNRKLSGATFKLMFK